MNADVLDVAKAVNTLAGRCNALGQVDKTLLEAWIPSLIRFSAATLNRAAETWPAQERFLPALGVFLGHVQQTSRDMAADERAAYASGGVELTGCPQACEGGWVRVDTSDIDADLYGHTGVTTAVAPCPTCQPLLTAIRAHRDARGHPENPKDCHDCRLLREDPASDIGWLHEARIAQGRVRVGGTSGEPAHPDRVKHLIADAREALADGIARRQERIAERDRNRYSRRPLPGTAADDVAPLISSWHDPVPTPDGRNSA